MSLITTCPSCLSQYSVSPETLRIADGWVGCGQCGFVYDATKTLKNVPVLQQNAIDAPVQVPVASSSESVPLPLERSGADEALSQPLTPPAQPDLVQVTRHEPEEPDPVLVPEPEAATAPEEIAREPSDEHPPSSQILSVKLREALLEEPPEPIRNRVAPQQAHTSAVQHEEPLLRLDVDPEPQAVEDAKRAAQLRTRRHEPSPSPALDDPIRTDPWRDFDDEPTLPLGKKNTGADPFSGVKKADNSLLQSILMSVLVVALVFQCILYYRDFLSSIIPAMRPPLQQACVLLKCKVHSWRNIDAVVIQHASLTQNDAGYYKMNLAVRNSAAQKVAMPSVELSLLDANGTIMLRRVLSPEDLRAPEVLQTGKVWEGEWMIQIAVPLPLSNYKIQVLYP